MATYVTSLIIPRCVEDTFAYISDFRHSPTWDPQTLQAYKVTDGPIALGTRYLLIGAFLTQKMILPYEIIEYDPPHTLALFGETDHLSYRDRIGFEAEGNDRTRLTYNAQLDFKGILRIGEPALQLVFQHIGDRATERMPEAVAAGVPAAK